MAKKKKDMEVFDSMFEDLPDGAYFAAMEECGFGAEDFLDEEE